MEQMFFHSPGDNGADVFSLARLQLSGCFHSPGDTGVEGFFHSPGDRGMDGFFTHQVTVEWMFFSLTR